MPNLTIEQPGVPPVVLSLAGQTVHLGRAEDNTVALVADEVSRHHAKLVFRAGHYVLYDLESLNGAYVNRQRVVERVLADGDELFLGSKCRMLYRQDDPSAGPAVTRRGSADSVCGSPASLRGA